MQYHLDGYRSGDPRLLPADAPQPSAEQRVDVAIVGCGPAGLTLAAQLSAVPGISVRLFERKPGPLEVGQADGIACRSMEMFDAFGFADRVLAESYRVNETCFWRPGDDGQALHRADRIPDVEDDLSQWPHVILNQARVHDFYLELMRASPARLQPEYARELAELSLTDDPEHPVTAVFGSLDKSGAQEIVQARYLVGCDGARSTVRQSMGLELKGEAARQLWGVMDVLAITDFPDIRRKCAIQSSDQGSVLIIPREGGYLVRLYIELDELRGNERVSDREVTPELLQRKVSAILAPYRFRIKEVAWWSAYEIGQRLCDAFDDVPPSQRGRRTPRLFIAGDACHTHSPKAGQGMNVSMADAFNLGWKLAAVLQGQAPATLLHTYTEERHAKALELIDFDRDMARLFSTGAGNADQASTFQRYFQQHGRYTAGVETRYAASMIVGDVQHQLLATGLTVGKRFHSAPVIRLADARPMQLGEMLQADGRWRLIAFADSNDDGGPQGRIAALCRFFESDDLSPVVRCTPAGTDVDSLLDVRVVFQQHHHDLDLAAMPSLLLPRKGRLGLIDYEKVFCADPADDLFERRGVARGQGALILVRPDQFVALVLPLDAQAALIDFCDGVLLTARPCRLRKPYGNVCHPSDAGELPAR